MSTSQQVQDAKESGGAGESAKAYPGAGAGAGAGAATPGAPPVYRPRDIMLLDFLREHDAACPVCGYSLKALTRPICPECGHELTLTVGATQPPLGWLLAALAPGFFSGIAACFVLIPIAGQSLFGTGAPPPLIIALDLFGWCSGIFAMFLAINRHRFLGQTWVRQRWFALTIWIIHIAALGLFILLAAMYL